MKVKIAPSILAADFARLGAQVTEAEAAGADYIHVDVMDGHFVPNLTMGPHVVRAVRSVTDLPLDVHLMIEAPERQMEAFCQAGASNLTVHVETCRHLHRTVQQIHELGCRAGVTLNPATPAVSLQEILPYVDLVLVMTVNPGFGGQEFIVGTLPKIRQVRAMLDAHNPGAELEVDGGIDPDTIPLVLEAGARVLVAGTAIFGQGNVAGAMRRFRDAIQKEQKEPVPGPSGAGRTGS